MLSSLVRVSSSLVRAFLSLVKRSNPFQVFVNLGNIMAKDPNRYEEADALYRQASHSQELFSILRILSISYVFVI